MFSPPKHFHFCTKLPDVTTPKTTLLSNFIHPTCNAHFLGPDTFLSALLSNILNLCSFLPICDKYFSPRRSRCPDDAVCTPAGVEDVLAQFCTRHCPTPYSKVVAYVPLDLKLNAEFSTLHTQFVCVSFNSHGKQSLFS